ncbi:MAG: oligosaccharide flippase family protein [Solirubrobacteraceae bacterium]
MTEPQTSPTSLSSSVKRGVAFSTLSFGLSKGLSLVAVLALTRVLAPSQFGVVAGVLVVLSLIELTSDLGMKATVIYEQRSGTDERLQTAFTLNVLLASLLSVLGVLIAPLLAGFFHASHHVGLFRLAFADVLITGLGSIHDGVLLRDLRFGTRIATEVLNAAVRATVGVGLALLGAGAASLVWGMLAGSTAWTIAQWSLTRFRPRLRFKRHVAASMISYGVGASALTLLSQIYSQLDPSAVGRVLGQRALGLYTVAFRLPTLVLENISYQISLVAFPALARKRVQDIEGVGAATHRLVRYQALYALPVAAAMAALARPIIEIVFSSRWREAAGVFAAVSVLSGISASTFALGDGFKALGRQRTMVSMSLLQLPLLLATIILAAPHGITTVAWARAGSELLWAILMVMAASRVLGVSVRGTLMSIWPGAAAAGGALSGALAIRGLPGLAPFPQVVLGGSAAAAGALLGLGLFARATLRELVSSAASILRPRRSADANAARAARPGGSREPLRGWAPRFRGSRGRGRGWPASRVTSGALMGPTPGGGELASLEPPAFSASEQAIGPYLRAVRRHWMFVVTITVITAAVATITALKSGRTYQATATILVTPLPQSDPNFVGIGVVIDSGDPARTVQTAAALIDSASAAQATANALGKGWTIQTVQKAISVTPLGQSDVLSVDASGSSPTQAALLASTFAQQAVARRAAVVQHKLTAELAVLRTQIASLPRGSVATASQLTDLSTRIGELSAARSNGGDPTLSVDQLAQPPSAPSGASRALIGLLGLLGGFALASVGALGLEFFSRPVRDEQEMTALFPAPVLASIPRVRHRGPGPLSPWLLPPAAFEQVRILRVQLDLAISSPVIMVTSAGAGDGKTTLVAALAAAFAESGQGVVVMDLDLRRQNLSAVLEVPSEPPYSEGESLGSPGLRSVIVSVSRMPNVKLLHFPGAKASDIDAVMDRLPRLLAQAQRSATCVILDTAPVGEVSEALRIVPMCETVLFVGRPRHTDRRRLALARDLLSRAGARVAGLVLTGTGTARSSSGYYDYAHHTGANGGPAGARGHRVEPAGKARQKPTRD